MGVSSDGEGEKTSDIDEKEAETVIESEDVLLQVAPSSRNPFAPNKLAKRSWHRHNERPHLLW